MLLFLILVHHISAAHELVSDYLWHFDAFRSNVAKLYAGFGGVVGIGRERVLLYTNMMDFIIRSDNGLV